jgi:transcriptional regulator with XRE-family HTH domain
VYDLRRAIGVRVRTLRKGLGLSQEELGHRARLHATSVSRLEGGRFEPGLNTLAELAAALQATLPELVSGLEEGGKAPRKTTNRKPPLIPG